MSVTRRRLMHAAAVSAVALAGCSGDNDGSNGSTGGDIVETTMVTMRNDQFDPRNISVDEGATVTWTNDDSHAHTVTNSTDNWTHDVEVGTDESTQFTFEESGVYDVYCRFHGTASLSGMSMKVGVGDATIDDPLGGGTSGGGGGGGPY